MTQLDPSLLLRRLMVFKDGRVVNKVNFQQGLNIIAGPNGSGKSTVAEFIFYGLGGDTPQWKQEAALCDHVYCEIEINGHLLTLRRQIAAATRQPMSISWTDLDASLAAPPTAWESYPFAVTASKESFSQVLFRALSLPEVQDQVTANRLTMHQLLRLLYADQVSGLVHLLRAEDWDPKDVRQLIADLAFGLYDGDYYAANARLIAAREELAAVAARITASEELLLGPKGSPLSLASLQAEASQLRKRQVDIEASTRALLDAPEDRARRVELRAAVKNGRQALEFQKRLLREAEDRMTKLEYEIGDSDLFVSSLKRRLEALMGADVVLRSAGWAAFEHCPACLSALGDHPGNTCALCGKPLDHSAAATNFLQLQNDLSQQVAESTQLQERRRAELEDAKERLPVLRQAGRNLQKRYDDLTSGAGTERELALASAHREQGYIERQLEDLQRRIVIAERVEELRQAKATLAEEISDLDLFKREREYSLRDRRVTAEAEVGSCTVSILHRDLPREEGFERAKTVAFSIRDNYLAVDGKTGFSASATVLLKNAIHLGILFASLRQPFFRYPRFVLLDNIEDKGMEQARSHNFQKVIADMSNAAPVRHQIIFSTSMLAPQLDSAEYVVAKYDTDYKSVQFGGISEQVPLLDESAPNIQAQG